MVETVKRGGSGFYAAIQNVCERHYNFLMAQQTDGGYAVEMPDEQERAAVKNKILDFSAIDGEMREAAASCYALGQR